MGQVISLPVELWRTTTTYWGGFFHYLRGKGRTSPYQSISSIGNGSGGAGGCTFRPLQVRPGDSLERLLWKQHAQVHLYTLTANFYLYDKPHYRKASYRDDLVDNLRNVAIPGTGVPLSWMMFRRPYLAGAFLLTGYPAISFIASIHHWFQSGFTASIASEYETRLLAPNDWFCYWRLNCVLVALHHSLLQRLDRDKDIDNTTAESSASAVTIAHDLDDEYRMENKWTFLETGEARRVPVSPFLTTPTSLVVKHRNEEGGMGIFFYKNAVAGGDWILQERLNNSDWVKQLLPENAPLSTFRVITASRASFRLQDNTRKNISLEDIVALSTVFRAGRKGALTDHDSILFDVDSSTGMIRLGTTNAHWYQLGWWKALRCPWRSNHGMHAHPDAASNNTVVSVSGRTVPNMQEMLTLVRNAHKSMCPTVPLAGWDVVLCDHPTRPICLLEVNLSCNFFRGSFDRKLYLDFCDSLLSFLQDVRLNRDRSKS